MNKLSTEERKRVVACLVEGNSLRATVRMTNVHRTTIQKLLIDLGKACSAYQDKVMKNLPCKRIQCDEIWSFVSSKEKNTSPEKKKEGCGDAWTWVALDPDSKLVPCWLVGTRDAGTGYHFIHDLAARLANRVQLTTDGHKAYLSAVEDAFGCQIDYAMLIKIYGNEQQTGEVRYSPAQCMGAGRGYRFDGVKSCLLAMPNSLKEMQPSMFDHLEGGFCDRFLKLLTDLKQKGCALTQPFFIL